MRTSSETNAKGYSRRKGDLSDVMRIMLLASLMAGSFIAGVFVANRSDDKVIKEVSQNVEQVRDDLERSIQATTEFNSRHICNAANEHLSFNLALQHLAKEAGLSVRGLQTHLEPEIAALCDSL